MKVHDTLFDANHTILHSDEESSKMSSLDKCEENVIEAQENKMVDNMPTNTKKRKELENDKQDDVLLPAKRIKSEFPCVKTENIVQLKYSLDQNTSQICDSVIKKEKTEEVDSKSDIAFDKSHISNVNLHILDKKMTYSEVSTMNVKPEKQQSKITSFFNSPSRNTHPPIKQACNTFTPPYSDYLICCNCTYYKILKKEDLIAHSKFHTRIPSLESFNRCNVMLKTLKIYNSDDIGIKQQKVTTPIKSSPKKVQRKSTPNKKWNDKSPFAKVLKTLTKEPQDMISCIQDVIKRANLSKKKVIPEMLAAFFLFIRERHLIWERRHTNMPPKQWTDNKILKEHWFTNIYRELDRGTAFFKRNLHETVFRSRKLEPLGGSNHLKILKRILLKCFSYRLVNRLATFLEFGKLPDVGDYEDWVTFLRYKYQLQGGESIIFTRAHQNNGLERYFKTMEFVKSNLSSMAKELQEAAKERSVKKCFFIIKEVPGVGKFMSWQILCDLLELRQLGDCTDNQWTCLGPGARNGLHKIFKEVDDELQLTRQLRNLCQASGEMSAYEAMDLDAPLLLNKEVSLKNIEHALCEFDKYVRFARGDGVRQRRFNKSTSSAEYDKLTQNCPECYCAISIENQVAKPNRLKEKECPLCKRLYHNGCTSKQHKDAMVTLLGGNNSVWICPSCLPMVDQWQKEDFYFDEPSSPKKLKRSPKKKTSSSIDKFIKKNNHKVENVKENFLTFELNTEKHIDTITLSDSDESDVCDLKYLPPKNKKLAKVKNNKKRLATVQNTEICDISNDECSEYEKENILNSVHGDIDNELGYSDEKEIAFRKKIRSLPLF